MHDDIDLVADYGHDVTTVSGAELHLSSVEPSPEGSRIDSPSIIPRRLRSLTRSSVISFCVP